MFAESDSDRFETATALWKNWSHDLRYSLEVDQGDMDNFSRIFTTAIVDKHHVTPIPESEVKSICWKMVGALTAKENKWGTSNPNQKFHQEFEAALKNDREFEQLLGPQVGIDFPRCEREKGEESAIRGGPVS